MTDNFITYDGEVLIENNHLQINDRQFKWHKPLSIGSLVAIVLYGVLIIIKYFKTGDPFDLWPGIIIIVLGIPALIVQSRIIYDNKINFKDIKRIVVRHNLANHLFADIILHTGKKRRLMLDREDLGQFERNHLDALVEALRKKKLATVVR